MLAEAICASAFVIEISRALGGNTLSWAYVFEWPILGGYGLYMWHQLVSEHRGGGSAAPQVLPEKSDTALAAYNEYLARVHAPDAESEQR